MKILKLLLIIQFKGRWTLYIKLLHLLNSSLYKTVAHGTVLAQIFLVLLFIRPASSNEEEIFLCAGSYWVFVEENAVKFDELEEQFYFWKFFKWKYTVLPQSGRSRSWHDAFVFPNSEKHNLASTSNKKPVLLENTRIAVNQTVAKPKRGYRKDTPFRNIEAFYLFVVQNDCVWNYSDQRFSYSSFQSADFHNCR